MNWKSGALRPRIARALRAIGAGACCLKAASHQGETLGEVAFIGGGRVTRILVGGWRRAEALPTSILVPEPDDEAWRATAATEPSLRRVPVEEAAAAAANGAIDAAASVSSNAAGRVRDTVVGVIDGVKVVVNAAVE